MILVSIRMRTKCFKLLKMFQRKVLVCKIFVVVSKQATMSILPTQKVQCSLPLDSDILLLVSRQSYRWMFEGQSKGRIVIKETYRDALEILFKGLDHLPKVNTVGSSRDYDLLIYGSLLKRPRFEGHDCFSKGNQSGLPQRCSCASDSIQFIYLCYQVH